MNIEKAELLGCFILQDLLVYVETILKGLNRRSA